VIVDNKGLQADTTAVEWRRRCDNSSGNCLEVAFLGDGVMVRDSKDQGGPVLTFTRAEWDAFTAGIKGGEFDF